MSIDKFLLFDSRKSFRVRDERAHFYTILPGVSSVLRSFIPLVALCKKPAAFFISIFKKGLIRF
ncbi:hypothetical protein B5F54_07255 [Anaeromassilibacillus sp. An250]|nr:hypothetical protein B5F54_07255 [Anaeromassilibacillus sp. An250]